MIKEVEIRPRNYLNIVSRVFEYEDMLVEDPTSHIFNGTVSDEGETLKLELNIDAPKNSPISTVMMIDYNIVDYSNKVVLQHTVVEPIVKESLTIDQEYTDLDLSSVLEMPMPIESIPTDYNIVFQIFTYEANIEEAYGQKRLSVPYNATIDSGSATPQNTDGIYTIYYSVLRPWQEGIPFVEGQLTTLGSELYVAIRDSSNAQPDENTSYWKIAESDDIRNFASGTTAGAETSTLVNGTLDMLITRGVSQDIVNDLIGRLSYRDNDDDRAQAVLDSVMHTLDVAVVDLEEGEHIAARYQLDKVLAEHRHMSGNDHEVTLNTKKSRYTL
jgi:hypothetical protein